MPPIQLDHIAIALPRIADAPAALVDVLGGVPDRSRPAEVFRWASWTFAAGGVIEILEPAGPDGFLHRFLAAHGRGVHHVTLKVPDLALVCHRAETCGYDIVGRDESDPSWKEAFLHPKQALGIVVQLVESGSAPPRDPPASIPPGLPDPPPAVSILGLRRTRGSAPSRSGARCSRARWEIPRRAASSSAGPTRRCDWWWTSTRSPPKARPPS
jgi:methylmalonyl-CoA/ethylmalonyl-CoA epimerase